MNFLIQWERKLRRFAVPHITVTLIVAQVVIYFLSQLPAENPPNVIPETIESKLWLVPRLVMAGEVWRLVSFLAIPPTTNILFAFFFWYLFYLMGTSLELRWGTFHYNLYLLIGYLATVGTSFLQPDLPSTNIFLQTSIFLAFAYLYPNFQLSLFFLFPIKIKWFALLTWIGYFLTIALGDWPSRLLALASVGNFLLFFGRDLLREMRTRQRHMAWHAARLGAHNREPFHQCTTCGITDHTHPTMDFRYCDGCAGTYGYCIAHIHNHKHVNKLLDTGGLIDNNEPAQVPSCFAQRRANRVIPNPRGV